MSSRQRITFGFVAVALVALYSIVMMATSGAAGSWAWILLVGVVVSLAVAARSGSTPRAERRDG